jgi:hypothetical protein
MNMRRLLGRLIIIAGTLICWAGSVTAQTNFSGGLHFNVGFPEGDLKDQLDRNAYGIGGQLFYSPQRSPIAIGLELGYLNYGRESRREPFSTTIPDVTVKVSTSNNIVQGFLVARVGIPNGPIQPYGDAIIGFNYLFTETKISDVDEPTENVASSVNLDDGAFAYGFGGGLMVPVYTGRANNNRPFQISIDVGARYVLGDRAQYLKEGSIRRQNGKVRYDLIESKTNMVRLHVGVMGRF